MGENIFCGKQIGNNEWVTGYYVKCRGHHYILPVYDTDHGFDERYADWEEVDFATLYQHAWIPVAERLPETYGDYMVAWRPVGMEMEYDHYYEIIEFDPEDESGWIGTIEQSPGDYEILAWMPLPKRFNPPN